MYGQIQTLVLENKASSEAVFVLYKKAFKALHTGDLILDGACLTELSNAYKQFFVSAALEAAYRKHKLLFANFSDPLKVELSSIKKPHIPEKDNSLGMSFVEKLGLNAYECLKTLKTLLYMLTECIYWSTLGLFDKNKLPFRGSAKQLILLGSEATGIVFLLVFLIGFTLALQCSNMLNAIGAGDYLAGGVAFLMFAEMGPLLTSIILAGRSGSAITAEIASMSVYEEIKALRSMGIHPIQYLILPRFKAMSIAVPLLSFTSSMLGCVAGLFVAEIFCGISARSYFEGVREGLPFILLMKSVFKSLVFGWIVTLIACQQGFKAHGGADAVGKVTTRCVVYAISGIILADAAFSFVFY